MSGKQPKVTSDHREHDRQKRLYGCVEQAMQDYFSDLDGHSVRNLYALFTHEVEKPFFDAVMKHTCGNITKAAQLLGINRATLKTRLKKYGLA